MATATTTNNNKTPPATASPTHATTSRQTSAANPFDEDHANNNASLSTSGAGQRNSLAEAPQHQRQEADKQDNSRGARANSLAEPPHPRRDVLGLPPNSTRHNTTTTATHSPITEQTISYSAERIIGNGSFGVVFQASVVETGEIVAIKKVLQDKRFKNRELQIMRLLVKDGHSNIVGLKHCFYSQVRFIFGRHW